MIKATTKGIVIVLISLMLLHCSKEIDPTPTAADLIIGNWKISTVAVALKVGSQSFVDYLIDQGFTPSDAQLFASAFALDYEDLDGNIDIKKGGTYQNTSGGSTDKGTWDLSSDGKTLTLDRATANETIFTVKTLTNTNLNLSAELSDDTSGDMLTIFLDLGLTR